MDAPSTASTKQSRIRPTRRAFLIGAGATAGLAIGFMLWPRERALNLATRADETLINGWIKIGTDGRVIAIVPQAEMGQGVYTALPQILADELGADWQTIAVEAAPLHAIYANTVMMADAANALPGFLQGIGRWAITELVTRNAVQATGGSTSVRAFFEPLRLAGAAARAMLCKAAASEWDVDWEECDTVNGFVVHESKRLRFADVAVAAADEEPPSEPRLREPGKQRLIGKSVPRIDIPSKTDGSARFGADVRLPGMVYAAVRAGPVNGAALANIDASEVEGRPGIFGVVKGDNWVAVAAETWWEARRGLGGVKTSFENGPAVSSAGIASTLKQAIASDDAETFVDDGDALDLLEAGPAIKADYSVPFLAHACLEPMTTTVRITDDGAEVWAPTQSVTLTTWRVADALGLSDDAVTVYPTLVGGGFGRKAEVDASVQAALIAKQVGRPVQLIWSREEDIGQDKYRPAAAARMRAKLNPTKRVEAWHARIAVPSVGASFMSRTLPAMASDGPDAAALEGALHMPYDLGSVRIEHAHVSLPVPTGYWRSVGHSYTAFFVESFIDELAHAAGTDPLTFRLRMMDKSPRHAEVLKVAASRGGLLGAPAGGMGRGIALHESFGSIVAQVAEVQVGPDGGVAIRRVTCVVDCGRVINPDIVRAQMEGGVIFGLSAALHGQVRFANGHSVERNFDAYPLLTMAETPEIDVHIIPSTEPPSGVGEPGVPPVAPAIANAVFAATGIRVRDLPFAGKTLGAATTQPR